MHGYFQLAIDEESLYLTTFLLPQGRFRYLRAPMGLNASSDEWCRHSDVAVEGLEWGMRIVDDKDVLLSTKMVQPFNPQWTTVVLTDASRLNGIGFALVQFDPAHKTKKQFSLVQCGSSTLTSAQGNYATIELECLAI